MNLFRLYVATPAQTGLNFLGDGRQGVSKACDGASDGPPVRKAGVGASLFRAATSIVALYGFGRVRWSKPQIECGVVFPIRWQDPGMMNRGVIQHPMDGLVLDCGTGPRPPVLPHSQWGGHRYSRCALMRPECRPRPRPDSLPRRA